MTADQQDRDNVYCKNECHHPLSSVAPLRTKNVKLQRWVSRSLRVLGQTVKPNHSTRPKLGQVSCPIPPGAIVVWLRQTNFFFCRVSFRLISDISFQCANVSHFRPQRDLRP